jgi:uncharacterized protein
MRFLVYGRDGSAFGDGPDELHEAHQAYMDGWLPSMIARGPTLSSDGAEHTGSVHVIEADDAGTARRFASEEPYARAGWYDDVSVTPLLPGVPGTMWDRPAPTDGRPASFVRVSWAPRPLEDPDTASVLAGCGPEWLFNGLVLSDDLTTSTGFAGTIDLGPVEAREQLPRWLDDPAAAEVEIHRWQRGGRNQ